MFGRFIEQLKIRLQGTLPGEDVQFLMAPVSRQKINGISPEKYRPKKSAVLILLFPAGDSIQTVLIQRPVYDGVHSGQIAFPGGKFDEADVDLEQTALRETFEEIGVSADKIRIIGNLTDIYITPSNFLVTPYIGIAEKIPDFQANTAEVQNIILADLFSLNDESIRAEKVITHSSGHKIKTPYYDIEGFTIWGATAMIISELNTVVKESISF